MNQFQPLTPTIPYLFPTIMKCVVHKPTVCPSVAFRNPLLYQSLPIIIPFRDARLRRRKDGTDVDTTARGVVERLHRFP